MNPHSQLLDYQNPLFLCYAIPDGEFDRYTERKTPAEKWEIGKKFIQGIPQEAQEIIEKTERLYFNSSAFPLFPKELLKFQNVKSICWGPADYSSCGERKALNTLYTSARASNWNGERNCNLPNIENSADQHNEIKRELWEKRENFKHLYLSKVELPFIPREIGQFPHLVKIFLWSTFPKIRLISSEVHWPAALKVLRIVDQELSEFPKNLPANLEELNLWNNQITTIPPKEELPSSLTILNLKENKVRQLEHDLPSKLAYLNLIANPLETVFPQISWPTVEYIIRIDGFKIPLFPHTKESLIIAEPLK